MSYKSLYRKYRPVNFDEVKGQEHVVKTLKNIVLSRKITHAYIFSGPRGTGKTSVAKIFANVLNCMHDEDITKICNICAKNSNTSLDVIEMDAASNNGVDEIRDLKNKVELLPVQGRYKIYIIDEVHMLSKSAFNALLKTLEEPPKHVIFILATTDPQKIPATILSRAQRFNFKRISTSEIYTQICYIANQEGISYEEQALRLIARLANGGLRDALSLLDQVAAYSDGNIKQKDVLISFGLISNRNAIQLLNSISRGNITTSIDIFNSLRDAGMEANSLVDTLFSITKDWIIFRRTRDESVLELLSADEVELLKLQEIFAFEFLDQINEWMPKIKNSEVPFQVCEIFILQTCGIRQKLNKETITTNMGGTYDVEILSRVEQMINQAMQRQNEKINELKYTHDRFDFDDEESSMFEKGLKFENNSLKDKIESKIEEFKKQEAEESFSDSDFEDEFGSSEDFSLENFIESQKNLNNQVNDLNNILNKNVDDLESTLSTEINKTTELFYEYNENEANLNDIQNVVIQENESSNDKLITTQEISLYSEILDTNNADNDKTLILDISKIKSTNREIDKLNSQDERKKVVLSCISQASEKYVLDYRKRQRKINELKNEYREFSEQINLFLNAKIGAGNKNYICLVTSDPYTFKMLEREKHGKWFQSFVNKFFSRNLRIIVVLRPEWDNLVQQFKLMSNAEINFYQKKEIEPLEFDELHDNDYAEKNVTGIFGRGIKIIKEKR
ncbi:DNA polymerase III subunit gamma/tau [Mycoplasma anatis]|uniref:DNA polymerase III subunit gamma/tau n=1 Tax=Mycoplasmopsis anatis TaxID=171279 RepID=UPI001C4E2C39|nr:DNA polymerase III subunit gamma/tau [Mycoplasmopsis anatis]MBW0595994.1 DNA polymerase III subunit gamma/tau [Mycoplasmopsis anatis]MBW0597489.1 DNA polymerase III subunit gamma/tau [Mycoplasmopsis anatis]MBW0599734.1 DNA polymerase III subunit gamma/tau [Mycoplasmopsis anatis]MBW0600352.1 DNA polymerase III subunit gamma/tau [Mycoplasmopsis anatis]